MSHEFHVWKTADELEAIDTEIDPLSFDVYVSSKRLFEVGEDVIVVGRDGSEFIGHIVDSERISREDSMRYFVELD